MFYLGIFAVLWSAMTCSFGFTMDRSAALVPSTWDKAPSLDTYQRVDSTLNAKMQMTSTNGTLQAANAKMSTKLTEKMEENWTRNKRTTTESTDIGIKLVNNTASTIKNNAPFFFEKDTNVAIIPRNVILLLIDERGQDEKREENQWENYKDRLPFAIEGFLQRCHDKTKPANFSLDRALISENEEKDCDCEHTLRSNIGELLSWARETRKMAIGVTSGSNFSIPFLPRYEFDVSNDSDVKLELQENKHDFNDAWQFIDVSNRAKAAASLVTPDPKTEVMNYDNTWDVFDAFSKIRMAIFRILFESLSRSRDTSENDFSILHRSFPLDATVTNLIENTLKKLKSVSNNNGYMLVAVVPKNELALIVDLIQRETSLKDTLLIMTQICTGNKKSVPFVAQGPNSEILRTVAAIEDLPIMIKKATANNCNGSECINRQKRNIPLLPNKDDAKILEKSRLTEIKNITNSEVTVNTVKASMIEKQVKGSTSKTIPSGLVTALSVAASVVTTAVWASS